MSHAVRCEVLKSGPCESIKKAIADHFIGYLLFLPARPLSTLRGVAHRSSFWSEHTNMVSVSNVTPTHAFAAPKYTFISTISLLYRLLPLSIYMTIYTYLYTSSSSVTVQRPLSAAAASQVPSVFSLSISIDKQTKWKEKLKTTVVTCVECHILQVARETQRKLAPTIFSLLLLAQKQFFDKITFSAHYKLRVSIKTLRRPCAMTILYIPNWMISAQARKLTKFVAFISLSPKKKPKFHVILFSRKEKKRVLLNRAS